MAIDAIPFGSPTTQNEYGFAAPSVLLPWRSTLPREIPPGDLDAVTTALYLVYYQFSRDDPGWRTLARTLGASFQAPNEQRAQLVQARKLANATGETLDEIGFGVGLQRSGLGDADYRSAIPVRGASMVSDGTIAEVLAIVAGLFGPEASEGAYQAWYPAGFSLAVPSLTMAEAELLAVLLEEPIPAGVGVTIVVTSPASPGWWYTGADDTWAGPRWSYSGGSDASATSVWGFGVTVG